MAWKKKHSRNAVAAKARRRLARSEATPTDANRRKLRRPRSRARFRISIRDLLVGDSLTLTLTELPWPGRFVTAEGEAISAAQLCRMFQHALNFRP
jgi:hypothetical protein